MTREICKACWQVSAVGFAVPSKTWEAAVPEPLQNSVLCIGCFARFADEAGLAWDTLITFYPVSARTHWDGMAKQEPQP